MMRQGQLSANKEAGKKPCYAMIKAGRWGGETGKAQLHNLYPVSAPSAERDRMDVRIGEHTAMETRIKGSVALSEREAREPPNACRIPKRCAGTWKPRKYSSSRWGGGRAPSFASSTRSTCSGTRPVTFGISLPRRLLVALHYEGIFYEWNFSKFWMGSKQTFDCPVLDDRVEWNIDAWDGRSRAEIRLRLREAPREIRRPMARGRYAGRRAGRLRVRGIRPVTERGS